MEKSNIKNDNFVVI